MRSPSGNANRLAKNSILMYIRMLVLMVIGFLISRVLLQKLGISDFGVYSLVGSIVAMFSSMSGLFVSSTQRFLNFEMGRGNNEELKKVYNTSILVNILVSIIFVVCVEILGLWFIYHEINVPVERILATKVVLHLSVATSVVYIMTTPLDAVIVAHEKMTAYAYLTILDHLLKLTIIFFLYLSSDKLIFYAFLLFVVSVMMRLIYEIYCRHCFAECRYEWVLDKGLLKRMTSFAGWQLCGTTSYSLTHNGLNMLLNTFGGTIVNAARGVSYQAFAAVNQLIINLQLVISPYSVKLYASNNSEKMFHLFLFSSKILFLILNCAVLPIIYFTDDVLRLWLGTVPEYSIIFLRLLMIYAIVRALHSPIDTLFKSIGDIKQYQITESVLLSMPILLSYITLKAGMPIYCVFVFVIIMEIVNLFMILNLIGRKIQRSMHLYYLKVIFPITICLAIEFIFFKMLSRNVLYNTIVLLASEFVVIGVISIVSLTAEERAIILKLLRQYRLIPEKRKIDV